VTDRSGTPVASASAKVDGISERAGETDAAGRVVFWNMTPGSYKLRVEHDTFITLEKEFTVRRGQTTTVWAALSPAGSSRSGTLAGPSIPRLISIPELAERELIGREPHKESPIGCSGTSDARLIQLREPLLPHVHHQTDEMLYVVAGEATMKMGQAPAQRVTPGWFSIIPRGTVHSIGRTGKSPVILLSMLGGQPCATVVLTQATR
jgi:hypothetical protein